MWLTSGGCGKSVYDHGRRSSACRTCSSAHSGASAPALLPGSHAASDAFSHALLCLMCSQRSCLLCGLHLVAHEPAIVADLSRIALFRDSAAWLRDTHRAHRIHATLAAPTHCSRRCISMRHQACTEAGASRRPLAQQTCVRGPASVSQWRHNGAFALCSHGSRDS